ncbi:amino acid ABC transporter permease [Kitasatospora aureofaciens]|uniref:Amino acid ABC transporter permease n=2 Tax=Kitasatospora aureofaciens TaxID=1894 RepID=A0A8H9LWJ5_KITAU|nr:amino acid ABC transporter permease [Kitasatospora aureofaciens]UKZ05825.1 amino acid ABC transporter permease [Streptomyces viridifaciens]GGU94512.1 amino acid ABC transporter permease [Kitasatospora aureofaciens]HJD81640.1 amino acid ABC transporter permease [Kitasatospora aureofaciens]
MSMLQRQRQGSASVLYDIPGPRTRTRYRLFGVLALLGIAGLLWYAVSALADNGQFDADLWDPFQYNFVQQMIVDGLLSTLKAFGLAGAFSLALGALLASGTLSDHGPVRWVCTAIVQFFRAMPLLILIVALYYAFFAKDPMWALVLGLTLYNGSVQAEIIRSGVNAVPRGQGEAAYALGMRKTQVMSTILVPQAVRSMLPSMIGQLVVTLKDTSLGYIITYNELLFMGKKIASQPMNAAGFPYIPVVLVIAPIYIALCLLLTALARWIEARGRRGANRRTSAAA